MPQDNRVERCEDCAAVLGQHEPCSYTDCPHTNRVYGTVIHDWAFARYGSGKPKWKWIQRNSDGFSEWIVFHPPGCGCPRCYR